MKQFFAPISKINEKTREVHGILALEQRDKDGEIMDYADSKPLFEKWSKGIQKASGGKSVGNLREMHQPIISGHLTSIIADDELKGFPIISKVTNDDSWGKVLRGELNGFSIYGNATYRKRDKVNKAIRYAVEPFEASLVDNPCMYGAEFTLVKEDGVELAAKFAGEKKPYQFWHCTHDCDLLHKTESEATACTGIVAKSFNDEELEEEFTNDEEPVSKSMYDVSSLASNISSLRWISVDDSNKKKFGTAVKNLFSVLSGMVKVEKEKFEESLNELGSAVGEMKSVGMNLLKEDKMKLKVMKSAGTKETEEDDLYVEFDEEALATKIGKSVAKTAGAVIKEIFSDLKEDIQTLSDAVVKTSGLPKKSKVVVKSADRNRVSDDEEEHEEKVVKKAEKTSDTEDPELRKVMKAAFAAPMRITRVQEEEAEESDEEESDKEETTE